MRRALRIIVSILFLCAIIASTVIFFVALKKEAEIEDNLAKLAFGIYMVLYIPFFVSEISVYFDIMYFLRDNENKKLYKTIFRLITLLLSISIMSIAVVLPSSTVNLKKLENIFLILIIAHILTKLTFYLVCCFKEYEPK